MNQVGRYQILEELGRGACGVVYRALDPAIGRTVAIKSIRFSEFSDSDERRDLRDRVLREAQSAGKLSHPNIVTIYDVLESEDLAYIFMEFVEGSSLKDAMRRDAIPGREPIIGILRQIAEALDYAHRKGIIHRDIKPANIMISDRGLDRDGAAKIADFGIAKLISHEATHQRAFMGTPSYMSPEQLEGLSIGGASDQFALGVIVYELLTGEKPFAAENLAALHYLICKRPAKPVNEINPTLSESVNRVVERALAKMPEDRYSSCSEFIGALSMSLVECTEWRPVAPQKSDEPQKAAGNGWYAPETVISSRLLDGETAEGDSSELLPVIMPPEPAIPQTAVSTRLATEAERAQYALSQERGPIRPATKSTWVRIGVERPAPRTWGYTIAGCALIAILGVLLLRSLSNSKTNPRDLESQRVLTTTPEDLSSSKPGVTPPTDLTVPPVATPIGTDSKSSSSATVPVHTKPAAVAAAKLPQAVVPPSLPKVETPRAPVRVSPAPITPPHLVASDVELVSDPPGARVVVDNRSDSVCLAPCTVPLGPGRHTLAAELSGYATARKIFNVPVTGSIFISLMRSMGMLVLTSPSGPVTVSVDGNDYGPAPVKIPLSAGRHHLSISDGARHHDETIQVSNDGLIARIFRW